MSDVPVSLNASKTQLNVFIRTTQHVHKLLKTLVRPSLSVMTCDVRSLFCITLSIKYCFIGRQWMIYELVYCLSTLHDNLTRLLQAGDAPVNCDQSLCYNWP